MSYNVPVRLLQQGSVEEIGPSGTVLIASGGSLQVASGGAFSNAGVQSIASGGTVLIASGGSIQVASGGAISNAGLQSTASGGTVLIASGGSIQVASGAQINVAAAAGLSAPAGITINGTVAKWAFGTLSLTSGVGTLGVVGFTRVMAATANNILGEASGNGSATSVHVDLTLSGAGSVIFRAVAGTLGYSATQVISYQAFGT